MKILEKFSKAVCWEEDQTVEDYSETYSSRIQLPTEAPPQLMPVTMLLARLSLRGFSRLEAFIDMGCAPLC